MGMVGLLVPDGLQDGASNWYNIRETYRHPGNPLRAAVVAGHRYGLEVYAYFKPYETGIALVFPEGSPEAQAYGQLHHQGGRLGVLDPFVLAHPHLRIQRRTDDLPAGREKGPVCALK